MNVHMMLIDEWKSRICNIKSDRPLFLPEQQIPNRLQDFQSKSLIKSVYLRHKPKKVNSISSK